MKYYITKYQSNIREQPMGRILGVAHPHTFIFSVTEVIKHNDITWVYGFIYDMNGRWHEGYTAISNGDNIYMNEFVPHVQIPLPYKMSAYVTQLFGERPKMYAPFGFLGHNGIDLVGFDKDIYTVGFGQATVGYDPNGYGKFVKVVGPTLTTIYAHLSNITISDGVVHQGQHIGLEGTTGNSTGSHLHIDIRLNSCDINNGFGGRIDPLVYFQTWETLIFPNYVEGMNNYDKGN